MLFILSHKIKLNTLSGQH